MKLEVVASAGFALAVLVSDFEEERSASNRIGAPDPLLREFGAEFHCHD